MKNETCNIQKQRYGLFNYLIMTHLRKSDIIFYIFSPLIIHNRKLNLKKRLLTVIYNWHTYKNNNRCNPMYICMLCTLGLDSILSSVVLCH